MDANRYCDLREKKRTSSGGVPDKRHAVIFIHGIISSHSTFDLASRAFLEEERLADWEVLWFDYRWWEGIDLSGRELANCLGGFHDDDYVVLICHSMGGLVARCALATGSARSVKLVVQFGTPNRGALRTGQMAELLGLTAAVTRRVFGWFPRKQGLLDLTAPTNVIRAIKSSSRIKSGAQFVTIPGLFFHSQRDTLEAWFKSLGFHSLNVFLTVWSANLPLLAVGLARPHDGIVEESSVDWEERTSNVPFDERQCDVQLRPCFSS